MRFPRIVTHLFADGGRIIKTAKTDYSEHLERQDLSMVVRGLMKDQHKAMFVSLRAGEYDVLLEKVVGPLPEPPPLPPGSFPPPAQTTRPAAESEAAPQAADDEPPGRRQRISNPNLQRVTPSVAPPSPDALDRAVASLDEIPAARGDRPSKPSASVPPRSRKSNSVAPGRKRTATGQRPSAQFAAAPPPSARSIFGDGVGEKSLDEVILSYLAEDLEGGQE